MTLLRLPARRGLQFRIVALSLGLLLAIQVASLVLVDTRIGDSAAVAVDQELRTGERVFERMLRNNAHSMTEAAGVLATDYGFREAVASGDAATLASALENQSARAGASIAIYTDAQFGLQAATLPGAERFLPQIRRLAAAVEVDESIVLVEGRPYQLVATPLRAPLMIGWVAMGFLIEETLLSEITAVSSVDITLLTRNAPEQPWTVAVSTLDREPAQVFAQRWTDADERLSDGRSLRTLTLPDGNRGGADAVLASDRQVAEHGGEEALAVLTRSLRDATAPYRQLERLLIAASGIGMLAFAIGSVATARRITTPLAALTVSARRLGRGDYEQPLQVEGRDEIAELADGFEKMRQAVREREAEVRRLGFTDDLTDLPNRASFRSSLRDALDRRRDAPCSVLMLDLRRFKYVNDVLGHPFGDRLLGEVGRRLAREAGGAGQVVARMGSDVFAMLLPGADLAAARELGERVRHAFQTPITLDGHTVDLDAGVGIACSTEEAHTADALINRAELAMHASKQRNAGVLAYEPALDTASEQSLTLLGELRRAVGNDELRLWVQPKVALANGRVVGAEALLRWQHPSRGMVPPMQFIPFAEQTGFIRELTQWIIKRGADALRGLHTRDSALRLSINLSVRDLLDQDLPNKMLALAQSNGTAPVTLCLEITESAIMDDPQRAMQTLVRLHEMGFKLSIDDFGTGYSSLAYLKRLPVDELKIDQSFVRNMETDLDDAKIVRSVIQLAHTLGMSVVAEGVESVKTWKLLQTLHCDEAQGYLIAKPMPIERFADWLTEWNAPGVADVKLDSAFSRLA